MKTTVRDAMIGAAMEDPGANVNFDDPVWNLKKGTSSGLPNDNYTYMGNGEVYIPDSSLSKNYESGFGDFFKNLGVFAGLVGGANLLGGGGMNPFSGLGGSGGAGGAFDMGGMGSQLGSSLGAGGTGLGSQVGSNALGSMGGLQPPVGVGGGMANGADYGQFLQSIGIDPASTQFAGGTMGNQEIMSQIGTKAAQAGMSVPNFLTQSLGSAATGLMQALGANSAGNTAANSANRATDAQMQMFNTQNAQQAPYRQAGYTALGQLSEGTAPGGYFSHQFGANDLNENMAPNWKFALDQGIGATKNAANLQTGLVSGNTMKGVADYTLNKSGDLYQQAYNNYTGNQTNIFNRLSSIAGLGQTANSQSAQLAGAVSPGISSSIQNAGAAQAAGTIGATNAASNGASNALGWYSLPQIMNMGGQAAS